MTRDHEIELALEDVAMDKEGWAIAYTLLRCAYAIEHCARELRNLGNADALTPMGALEAHGKVLKEGLERLAGAIESINVDP